MVQQSWQASESASRHRWRRIRKIAAAMLLVGLVVSLIFLLVAPFLHPKTHLLLLAASSKQPLAGPQLDYLEDDLGVMSRVGNELSSRGSVVETMRLDHLASVDDMQGLAADLRSRIPRSSDILILYVCSTPVMLAESPQLLCGDVKPTMIDISKAAYPIEDLLDQVRQCDAAVKLLLMDVGRTGYDTRLGLLANRFPDRLRSIVQETDDPSLWVLMSNERFERSHVVRSLDQSAFVYFSAHGLEGAADASGDGYVSVDELYRYVAINVHAMVQAQTDGLASQTPQLLWGGGPTARVSQYPRLLAIGSRPREPEPQRLSRSLAVASKASRAASYYGLVSTPTSDQLAYRATSGLRPSGRLGYAAQRMLGPSISSRSRSAGGAGGSAASGSDTAPPEGDDTAGGSDTSSGADGGTDAEGAADAADGATPSGADAPDPEVERRKKRDRMAQQLADAWQLRDALRDRNSSAVVPFDYSPHLWRQLEQRLLHYDRQFRAGNSEAAEFADQLEGLVISMREFVVGKELISGASDPTMLRISAAQFDAWPDGTSVHSLGLAEFLADQKATALPEELQTRIDALDAFIDQGDQAKFRKWVKESLPSEYDRFQEFWLARRLAAETVIPWSEQQLAIRTRRLGEQVAAASWPSLPWVCDKIQVADRRRLIGERDLWDRIGEDWRQRARIRLREARQGYLDAQRDIRDLIVARQRSNDLADRSRAYVRWRWAAGRQQQAEVPDYDALASLLDALNDQCTLLKTPDPTRLVEVRRLDAQLAKQQQQIETGIGENEVLRIVGSPGDSWKIESLLLTSLPAVQARLRLLAGAARVEAGRLQQIRFPDVRGAPPSMSSLNREDWLHVLGMVRLERRLARLALSQTSTDDANESTQIRDAFDGLDTALRKVESLAASANPNADDLETDLPALSSAIRDFYLGLPDWIGELSRNDSDLQDPGRREAALRRFRTAMRCMQHVDPRDAMRLQDVDVAGTLARSALFDQLAWQRDRALLAREDAPIDEATILTNVARGYRQLAVSIPGQPILPGDAPVQVSLSGPTSISLATASEAPLQLTVHNSSRSDVQTWIVLDYDPAILQVNAAAEKPAYSQRMSESVSLREYPCTADLLEARTTFALTAGATESVDLTIRRLAIPRRPVRIICKVVASDPSQGTTVYLRHPVEIASLTSGTIELKVAGTPGSWTHSKGQLTLHAFANRPTDFELQLLNLTDTEQQVDVQLLGSEAIATPKLPTGAVPASEAMRLLARFEPTTVLVPRFPMTLSSGSEATAIPFPPSGQNLPAEEKQADADTESSAATAAENDAAPNGEEAPPKPLPRNLLLILTDVQTGRQTLRHIALTVQRPRKFLRPQVSYDPERERLELRLGLVAPGLLPPGKTRVRAELSGDVPAGLHLQLDAEISPDAPETVLYAPIPAAPDRGVTLHLSVDDYPRAFVYDVPCSSLVTDVPERTDLMDVRITELPDGEIYKSPAGDIPVRFEVDAPRGAFEDETDVLHVGYDLDRDRELNDEPHITLHADRQVELFQNKLSPDGRLTIGSRVGDFEQKLPAVPTRSTRLGVLAELSVGDQVAWSNVLELTVDGQPPRVYQPRLRPGPELVPGTEAELSVLATDDKLSGVATVEAAIDVAGTREFGGENIPIAAKQDPETGVWVAKLPTNALTSGSHWLLLRATDKVDNVSGVTPLKIRVMSPESAESATLNRIPGLVIYGQEPVAAAEVKLVSAEGEVLSTAVTNEQGAFEFSNVPPGQYALLTRGLIHNKYRTAEAAVDVAAPPAQVELLELRLR